MLNEHLYFNSIDGATGEYLLPPLTPEQVAKIAQGEEFFQVHLKELQHKDRHVNRASLYLTHSEEILRRSQQALNTARNRVDRLMEAIAPESGLAFGLSAPVTELAPPERTLLQTLQRIQQAELPTSFAP